MNIEPRDNRTKFSDFLAFVLERGGRYVSGITKSSDGYTYQFIEVFPKDEERGLSCMFEDAKPDDRMSQMAILAAKQRLMMF